MTLIKFRRGHGDSPQDVQEDSPLPVQIIADVESRNIRVNNTNAAQVSVSTSVITLIAPYNPNRRSLFLTNLTGSQICYLGLGAPAPALAAGTARALLSAAVGSNITIYAKDAVWGLSATGAQTITIWEEEYTFTSP